MVFTISPHASHAVRLPLLAGVDTPQQFCLHFYPVIGPACWDLDRKRLSFNVFCLILSLCCRISLSRPK